MDQHRAELEAIESLTPRQREVLFHLGMGLSNREIAKELGIEPKTVESHRATLARKLGVTQRVKLARMAIRTGLSPL